MSADPPVVGSGSEFDGVRVEIITIGGVSWFCGNHVAGALGYKNCNKAVWDHVRHRDRASFVDLLGGLNCAQAAILSRNQRIATYINKFGVLRLLAACRLPDKERFAAWCSELIDIRDTLVIKLYKEQETIGQLMTAFGYLRHTAQLAVGDYRVDLYFHDPKIAVECDELGHRDRDQEYERVREERIRDALGCTFIRYDPDARGFSIFEVIRRIGAATTRYSR